MKATFLSLIHFKNYLEDSLTGDQINVVIFKISFNFVTMETLFGCRCKCRYKDNFYIDLIS